MMFKNGFLKNLLVPVVVLIMFWGCGMDSTGPIQMDATPQQQSIQTPVREADGEKDIVGDLIGTVQRIITPLLGGTLDINTSRLQIRPFAVLVPTLVSFSINNHTPTGLPGALSREYVFTPHGLNFLVPATLYVSFQDAGLGDRNPYKYRLYYFNEILHRWEPQPTTVDATNQRFVVTLNHFSRYAFGR